MLSAPLSAQRVLSHHPEAPKRLRAAGVHPVQLCFEMQIPPRALWPGRGGFCSLDVLPDEPSVVPRCSGSRVCPLMHARDKHCSFSVPDSRKSKEILVFWVFSSALGEMCLAGACRLHKHWMPPQHQHVASYPVLCHSCFD